MLKKIFVLLVPMMMAMPSMAAKKKVCNDLKVSQCNKREDCSWIKKSKKTDRKAYCRKTGKKAKGKNASKK